MLNGFSGGGKNSFEWHCRLMAHPFLGFHLFVQCLGVSMPLKAA
jgi:hypothetical protein